MYKVIKMDIRKIIKAKLSDKTDMPEWYYKRLEACLGCPLNSLNFTPQTIPEKVKYASFSAANLGKPFCFSCGCELEAKASIASEECPGTPQRWNKVKTGVTVVDVDDMDYTMTNLSPDKVAMNFTRAEFVLNYGEIEYGADTKIDLLISPKTEEDFINLRPASGCGCTTPTIRRTGRDLRMTIEYDSKRLGEFSKLVTLDYTASAKNQIVIRIKGTVLK